MVLNCRHRGSRGPFKHYILMALFSSVPRGMPISNGNLSPPTGIMPHGESGWVCFVIQIRSYIAVSLIGRKNERSKRPGDHSKCTEQMCTKIHRPGIANAAPMGISVPTSTSFGTCERSQCPQKSTEETRFLFGLAPPLLL